MALRYVDGAVGSSGNGQSWATAWKALSNIAGLAAGDICYISGAAGGTTYSATGWSIAGSGNAANPIIYRVGQDSGHNGPATINLSQGITPSVGVDYTGIYLDGNYNGSRQINLNAPIGNAGTHGIKGLRLSYLNMTEPVECTDFYNFECDHNRVDLVRNRDHFFSRGNGSAGASSYLTNLIHHNTLYLYCDPSNGFGDDGFMWIQHCSLYNNAFITNWLAGTYTNHQDYVQSDRPYVAIFNNYFQGCGNYPIYGDFFGSGAHWRIYNNVSRGKTTGGLPLQHIALGFENTSGSTLDDVIIANNTIYDPANNLAISLGGGYSGNKVTNSYVVNNLCYNTDIQIVQGSGGSVTSVNNYEGTSNISFKNTGESPAGDFRLNLPSSNAIDKGISPAYLTSIFTTDADGYTRTGTWDIGAYEYGAGGATPPAGILTLAIQ